jgi:hypothetical protein
MKHVNTKMILSIMIVGAFLLGSLVTPVAALQSIIIEQEQTTAYAPRANNHTYIYSSAGDTFFQTSFSRLHVNEDIDLTQYRYQATSWSSPDTSYTENTDPPFNWQNYNSYTNGPLGNAGPLPIFFDFTGSDGSGAVINTTLERRVFLLSFGQHTPVVMDTQYTYYGALSISGQEFVYITVSSMQDNVNWQVSVYDPQGRLMYTISDSNGDITVLPFHPSVAGIYYLTLTAQPSSGSFAQFDFYPEAIAPQLISPSESITDTLPTSEVIVNKDTGSLTYEEVAPTVRTYKIDPGTGVSALYYSFNYVPLIFGTTQPVSIMFSSDGFNYGSMGGSRYMRSIGTPANDIFYYQGGVLYITVMGGDNTDYTLCHNANVATQLPVNHEFLLENYYTNPIKDAYSLTLEAPSLLKVNSTGVAADYAISIYGVNEDGYYVERTPTDTATIDSANWVYLPTGKYVVVVTVDSTTTSRMIEFTVGGITEESEAGIVYLGGFIVPTTPNHQYNLSLTLNNIYNVSSDVDIYVYDQFFTNRYTGSLTMGTWWDGVAAIPHPTDVSEFEVTLGNRLWSEDYATVLLVTYPYNNTAGVGNVYPDYALNFTIDWVDVTYYNFNETTHFDVTSDPGAYNFTLGYPATIAGEYYAIALNTTPGTWYNVSIMTADVNTIPWIEIHTAYDHRTHVIYWGALSDTLQGAVPDLSVQFGAISDITHLELRVNRALSVEGFLWIEVTPLPTHALELLPAPPVGPDLFAILGSIALPVGVGAAVIVVVAIVYVKKFKK